MGWVHLTPGRENHVSQEGFLAQRLNVGEKHRVVIIPLETKILPRHAVGACVVVDYLTILSVTNVH